MDRTGKWKLSPAYDVTFAYHPTSYWVSRHQLSVNGKREDISRNDLLTLAKEMNIKKAEAIIERVIKTVKKWPRFAAKAGVPASQLKAIAKTHLLKI